MARSEYFVQHVGAHQQLGPKMVPVKYSYVHAAWPMETLSKTTSSSSSKNMAVNVIEMKTSVVRLVAASRQDAYLTAHARTLGQSSCDSLPCAFL